MTSKPAVRTSSRERAYRAKHFHDIRAVEDKQIFCTSCGGKINVNSGKICTHRIIGTIQCEECWSYFDDIEFSSDEEDNDKYCRICGHNKPLIICKNDECHFGFCKKCIERNSDPPLKIKSKDWMCFICQPEPLWKLRAVCSAVKDTHSKRCDRKISSRSIGNNRDKKLLPHMKHQLADTIRLQKNLKTICDSDDDGDADIPMRRISLPIIKDKVKSSKHSNNKTLHEIRNVNEKHKKTGSSNSKSHQKLSTLTSVKEIHSDNASDDNACVSITGYSKFIKNKKSSAHNKSPNASSISHKNNSIKVTSGSLIKNITLDQKAIMSKTRKISESDSSDSIYVIKKGKRSVPTKGAQRQKSDINSQSENEEEDNRRKSEPTKSLRKSKNVTRGTNLQRTSESATLRRSESGSSSGKDFKKSKIRSTHFTSLKNMCELDKDYTKCGTDIVEDTTKVDHKVVGRKESKILKSYLNKKLGEIQDATVLMLTHLKQKNNEKEVLFQKHACEVLSNSERTINKLQKTLDKTWHNVQVFYKMWCKEQGLPEPTNLVDDKNDVCEKEESTRSRSCHSEDTNTEGDSVVSDCDSEKIFSDNEDGTLNISGKDESNHDSDSGNKWISVNATPKKSAEQSKENSIHEESGSESVNNKEEACKVVESSPIPENNSNKGTERESTSPILDTLKNRKDVKSKESNGTKTKRRESLTKHVPDNETKGLSKTVNSQSNVVSEPEQLIDDNNQMNELPNDTDDVSEDTAALANSTPVDNEKHQDPPIEENVGDVESTDETDIIESSLIAPDDSCLKSQETPETESNLNTNTPTEESNIDNVPSLPVDENVTDANVTAENNLTKRKSTEENDVQSDTDIHSDSTIFVQYTPKGSGSISDRMSNDTPDNSEKLSEKPGTDTDTEEAAKCALLLSDSITPVDEEVDSDDERAKEMLLMSSDSENSRNSVGTLDSLSSSGSNSKTKIPLKRSRDVESDSGPSQAKRKRFKFDKNRPYADDEKLQMVCEVRVKRLPSKVLRKYKKALEKSRQKVENQKIKSLVDLDKLERSRKKRGRNESDSNDSSLHSSTSRTSNKKAHLKGKKDSILDDGEQVENGHLSDSGDDNSEKGNLKEVERPESAMMGNEALLALAEDHAEKSAKQQLLMASDSSADEKPVNDDSGDNNSDVDQKKKRKKVNKKDESSDSVKESKNGDDESSSEGKNEKENNWRRDALLTTKFSDSDSEKEKEKWEKARENARADDENTSEQKSRKRRMRNKGVRRILDSDSDVKDVDASSDSDSSVRISESDKNSSDFEKKGKKKKKKKRSKSSDTDSSIAEKKPKPKRKRIKQPTTGSDTDSSEGLTNSQGSPNKNGRKNIRKVLKDKQVADDTKQAAKEEEDRLRRIAERQKLYNEIYEMKLANEEKVDKLVLDFDPESKKELVTVHESLVKRLKPHQAKGIKFMWDACFESLERIKNSKGSGCILAHCMGLGKTLQVITLSHTLLTHEETGIKTVLVVCPLSTVLNWANEYKLWLKDVDGADDIGIYELTRTKKNYERMYRLQDWQRNGGVLIIGYEMFRNLSNATKKMRKNMREAILQCLVDPGADLVVCDEGHLLKNEDTALSKCMRQVKTLRRIVLTGTPLQNNLIEYHCMVQFVKPNLLGTKKEFSNRFVHPITNGQFDNSTPYDVKLMKKRAHVLHKMLEGSVQRFDYSVLTPFLPPKQEYVIFVRLTEVQVKMYQYYLENLSRRSRGVGGGLFADFQELQRIWTHPVVLQLNAEKVEKNERKRFSSDSEGSLKDFIDDGSDSDVRSVSSDSDVQSVDSSKETATKRSTRNNPVVEEPEVVVKEEEKTEWWAQYVEPQHFEDMRISAKLVLLFEILKQSELIGDKVLVFSQSLYSLTLIEMFLSRIDEASQNDNASEFLEGHTGNWILGADYFRLDGQTSAENRSAWCRNFNKPSNTRARLFLISTRAGGLGINLTAANRVIIFDASWNPSHDVQSIFRIYRFGQKKPCYVYRLLASGTMEQKIYNRQVTKLSLSCRVVDEQQIERHYSNASLNELYTFDPPSTEERTTFQLPKDRLLADILLKYKEMVENYHEHDSLLENRAEEELDEEDRKQAWLEYEEEKKGRPAVNIVAQNEWLAAYGYNQQPNMMLNMQAEFEKLQQLIRKDYPNLSPEMQAHLTQQSLSGMYNYMERQVGFPGQQIAFRGNVINPVGLPQAVQQNLAISNAQSLNILQQKLASAPMQRQVQQQNNFNARPVSVPQPPQNPVNPVVINIDDGEIPSSSKNVQAPVKTPGDSKGQEE